MNTEKFIEQLISDHTSDSTVMNHVQTTVTALSGALRSISRNTGDPTFERIADELRAEFFKKLQEKLTHEAISK